MRKSSLQNLIHSPYFFSSFHSQDTHTLLKKEHEVGSILLMFWTPFTRFPSISCFVGDYACVCMCVGCEFMDACMRG